MLSIRLSGEGRYSVHNRPRPSGPICNVRVPKSDVEAAESVEISRLSSGGTSRKFAAMGAAILEKLCRSGRLSVHTKRTTPYILNTARGKIALSVMVSTVDGDPALKHMIVPLTALPVPAGVDNHVLVCTFVSKREKIRETHGGLNIKLAGWATADEVMKYARVPTRVITPLEIAAVPVSALHPAQTLRHYLAPKEDNVTKEGDKTCENPV